MAGKKSTKNNKQPVSKTDCLIMINAATHTLYAWRNEDGGTKLHAGYVYDAEGMLYR